MLQPMISGRGRICLAISATGQARRRALAAATQVNNFSCGFAPAAKFVPTSVAFLPKLLS
jgi:hypothetical protein